MTATISNFKSLGLALGIDLSNIGVDSSNPAPQHFGLVAWNGDSNAFPTGSGALTSGTIYLCRVDVPHDGNVTKLYTAIQTVATTPTSSQNWMALLDSSGAVLGSADITSQTTSLGLVTATISSIAVTQGMYYVAILQNASTCAALYRGMGAGTSVINLGTSGATLRWATNGTSQTTITNRTLASNSAAALGLWVAIG